MSSEISQTRTFGQELANIMTAVEERPEEDLRKQPLADNVPVTSEPMSKGEDTNENGGAKMFDSSVMKEILTRTHHNRSNLDDLVDDIEDFLDDNLLPNETVLHHGQEVIVKNKEKRGGLVLYNLENGSKTNSHDLKRKYSVDSDKIKLCINNFANFDGKTWQVNEEAKQEYDIKDKLAPIFFSPKVNKGASEEKKKENGFSSSDDEVLVVEDKRRISGVPPTATRKSLQAKENKEREKKQKADAKKEKVKEKVKEKKEKAQKIDKWTKKGESSTPATTSPSKRADDSTVFMTPQKRSERHLEKATERLMIAWKKRNAKEFQEAAKWAGEHLSAKHIGELGNSLWVFSVMKHFDKLKDARVLKKMSSKKEKQDYKAAVAAERAENYKICEAKLKTYFSLTFMQEDLELCQERLPLPGAEVEMKPGLLDCYEITQFLSSYATYLNTNFEVTAAELHDATTSGKKGFEEVSFKVLDALLGNLVHEYKDVRFVNIRLREFTSTAYTISQILRSFLNKEKERRRLRVPAVAVSSADQEEVQEVTEAQEEKETEESFEEMETSRRQEEERKQCAELLGNSEFYELESRKQIDILLYLTRVISELESARDFISDDNVESLQATKKSLEKTVAQLVSFEKNLKILPVYTEEDKEKEMTRQESRRMAEDERKRENLVRKIEDLKEKKVELEEKLFLLKSRRLRVPLIGVDRHFRRYYWFVAGTDSAIFVQDFGTSSYEEYVVEVAKVGQNLDESQIEFEQRSIPEEKWYKIESLDEIQKLKKQLLKNGDRESKLKAYLDKYLDTVYNFNCRKYRKKEETNSTPPAEVTHPPVFDGKYAAIKLDMSSFLQDLKNNYATSIPDSAIFETRIADADCLEDLKKLVIELAASIRRSMIIEKLSMQEAKETGSYSYLVMDKFLTMLELAPSVAGLHMLLNYLDSRVDWKQSMTEMKCKVCQSRRNPDAKIQCSECDFVCHYTCVKKREKPESYLCPTCEREAKKRKFKEVQKREEEEEEEEDETEAEEEEELDETMDQSDEEEEEKKLDDDIFTDEEDEETKESRKRKADGKGVEAKRPKNANSAMKEIDALFKTVKSTDTRLYRIMEGIHLARSRKNPVMTLEEIEENLVEYESVESLKADLKAFFDRARSYFAENNSRKLEDFDLYTSKVGI